MNQSQISARAACRRNGLDEAGWSRFIENHVLGTNGAFATASGGISSSTVAFYSSILAQNIKRLLDQGRPEDQIRAMSFVELFNA